MTKVKKISKLKLLTGITVIVFAVSLAFTATIVTASKSDMKVLAKGERYLNAQEISDIENSKEYRIAKEKTKIRLNDAAEDISKVLNISKDKYERVSLDELENYVSNNSSVDTELKNVINETYREIMLQIKV